jgi:hypothetical protein
MQAPILANEAAKPAADGADGGGENLARDQIGLRVRAQIGHEVEQHEAYENQHQSCVAVIVAGLRGNEESDCATDEADNLQRYAPQPTGP